MDRRRRRRDHARLVNTHNHIYSAFARGLSIKGYNPHDFNDILEGMWWKIDRLLTKRTIVSPRKPSISTASKTA
jgi:hypothetical protein